MRNGVVYVKQIKVFSFGNLSHLRSQRERVRLVFEERVRHHLDFVKAHALVQLGQARRESRRNEMNRVAARRKLFPKLRAYDSAAAISRIDRDAYVHKSRIRNSEFRIQNKRKTVFSLIPF